jgi:hypothetical protein
MVAYNFDFAVEVTSEFSLKELESSLDNIALYAPGYDELIIMNDAGHSEAKSLFSRVEDMEKSLADGEGGIEIMLSVNCTPWSDGALEFTCDVAEVLKNGSHQFILPAAIRRIVFDQFLTRLQDTPVCEMERFS